MKAEVEGMEESSILSCWHRASFLLSPCALRWWFRGYVSWTCFMHPAPCTYTPHHAPMHSALMLCFFLFTFLLSLYFIFHYAWGHICTDISMEKSMEYFCSASLLLFYSASSLPLCCFHHDFFT